MSTIDDDDRPACPACGSREAVRFSATKQERPGVLVTEYICMPCSRVFTEADA